MRMFISCVTLRLQSCAHTTFKSYVMAMGYTRNMKRWKPAEIRLSTTMDCAQLFSIFAVDFAFYSSFNPGICAACCVEHLVTKGGPLFRFSLVFCQFNIISFHFIFFFAALLWIILGKYCLIGVVLSTILLSCFSWSKFASIGCSIK